MWAMVNEWIGENGERERRMTHFIDQAEARRVFEEEREEIEAEGDSLKGISEAVRLYKMELVDQSKTQLR